MTRTPRPSRAVLAAAGLLTIAALVACETPFVQDADRHAYNLIEQRQKQSLGTAADTNIDTPMLPVPVTPQEYAKVPRTENSVGAIAPQAEAAAATVPGTAPATTSAAATGPATAPADPLAALMNTLPIIDLNSAQELPEFPRPVAAGKKRLMFNLDECFNYALAHSRDYRTRKEDLYLAALDVTLARHQFEPRLFATTEATVSGGGESSDYAAAFSAAQTVGVRQRLPYGGEIVASALVDHLEQLKGAARDAASADALLQANIPLLRGAGMVAQENLIQTERNLIYEVRDFERFRRAFLVQVASTYFNLVNQRAQVLNRYRSVRSYIFITQRTDALFNAGVGARRVSQLDLQRAKQSEFQARNDLTNAIEQYELAVDNFKILLGMPAEQPMDVAAQYLNITPPDVTDAAAVEIAKHLRLDLQTTRDQVEDARRRSHVASNNLLPNVDLTASARLDSDSSVKSYAVQGENLDYSAGVRIDWPLDRVAERNALRAALVNLSRAQRNVETAEDQVSVDVRASIRRVRQQQYLVALQRSNIALAQSRKEFADIQFKNGKIDNRDYLDAETALLDAQNRFAQAVSSLQITTLQYLRDTDQLRVDFKGRLLVPAAAAGVSATQPAAGGRANPLQGTTAPAPDFGKPLPALEPTTNPNIPNPDPNSNSTPP